MTAEYRKGFLQRDSVEHKEYAEVPSTIHPQGEERNGANDLLEAILDRENLNKAYKRVKRNHGAAGIDGMTVEEALPWLREHREELLQSLRDGSYKPSPVRRKEIPKPDGGVRKLGIMKALSPYMFCNAACGDIYAESLKNINKFRKRSSNTIDFGAIEVLEDQMDIEAPELGIRLILSEGLSVCTPLQRERIQKYYIEGMSLSEIAEGKNISTVQQSIDAGIKKMKNFFGVNP